MAVSRTSSWVRGVQLKSYTNNQTVSSTKTVKVCTFPSVLRRPCSCSVMSFWTDAVVLSRILIQHRGMFEAPTPPLLLSRLQHHHLFPDYICHSPHPPPPPPSSSSPIIRLSASSSSSSTFPLSRSPPRRISHGSSSSSFTFGLSHPSPLCASSPPSSSSLCTVFSLCLFTSTVPPDGFC